MSTSLSIDIVQQNLTRYGMTTYLILGNIGLILNILFFSQKSHRLSPCSLYLLASTICRFFAINIALIPIWYALDHADLRNTSSIFCKVQYYTRHVPNQMVRSFIVLACIDRYALCSMRGSIRKLSQYYVAIRLIPCVVFLWLLATLFIPILQSLENGKCGMHDGTYSFAYTIYNLITSGIFPPVMMIVFGALVMANLKEIRSRIQPTNNNGRATTNVIRKRDRDLIRISLVEVVVYLITTTPYTVVLIYSFATRSMRKSSDQQKLESFISFLAQSFLLHLNNALPFWIFILTLRSFRLEFSKLMMKMYRKLSSRTVSSDNRRASTMLRGPTVLNRTINTQNKV